MGEASEAGGSRRKPVIAVIGGGPAGLMAAEAISEAGGDRVSVTVYDRMPSLGRKLLMAGRGGLNLTHSEDLGRFLGRYGARAEPLGAAIEGFSPQAARDWAAGLGQETFVGSSGRVFPVAMKASPLLRAWLSRLSERGVGFAVRHRWIGWAADGSLCFETPAGAIAVAADATVLAAGGASWPRLGSDGSFAAILEREAFRVLPLVPANCGFEVRWSEVFRSRFAGEPLKRIALIHGEARVRGEAVVTAAGLEGGAVYQLSARLRETIRQAGAAEVLIDLRPDLETSALARLLAGPRSKQSLSSFLRKSVRLAPVGVGLVQEAARAGGHNPAELSAAALAALIKAVPLRLVAPFGLDRAISSAGGLAFEEIDASFMLKRRPGTFAAGEMLDWEAPTGGYLLQACLATGRAAGQGAVAWVARSK